MRHHAHTLSLSARPHLQAAAATCLQNRQTPAVRFLKIYLAQQVQDDIDMTPDFGACRYFTKHALLAHMSVAVIVSLHRLCANLRLPSGSQWKAITVSTVHANAIFHLLVRLAKSHIAICWPSVLGQGECSKEIRYCKDTCYTPKDHSPNQSARSTVGRSWTPPTYFSNHTST